MEKLYKQVMAIQAENSLKPLELSLGNNSPILTLTCHECGLVKKSSEEMEIHIKVEHIDWLPFKCPHCKTRRAADVQMREHIHASHRQNTKEYFYVDNLEAKKKLVALMDLALYATVTKKMGNPANEEYEQAMSPEASTVAHSTTSSDSPPGEPSSPPSTDHPMEAVSKMDSLGSSNTDALLASITRAAKGEVSTETVDPLTYLLTSFPSGEEGNDGEVNESMDIGLSLLELLGKGALEAGEVGFETTPNKKVTVQQSKRKVVGQCKACKKPVTAGARQMHLFFHLAKDYRVFRFYCKYENCDVEHYRKDQMEHHMTKVHGAISPELIGDRTDELYQKSKELQHELLGEMNVVNTAGASSDSQISLLKRPAPPTPSHPPDDKQTLQCSLCKKFMENRVKGFHILHHLARDCNILRYTCKLCVFAHDRSQSVLGHGKKEHGREDVVLDRIGDYENEVQAMSQKCFGIDTNFETSKKRTKGSPYIVKKPKFEEEVGEQSDPDESPFPPSLISEELLAMNEEDFNEEE